MKHTSLLYRLAPTIFILTLAATAPLNAQDPKVGNYKGTITVRHVATSIGTGTLATKSTAKVAAEALIPAGRTHPVIHILAPPDPGKIGAIARKYCRIDFGNTPHDLFFFEDDADAVGVPGTETIKGDSVSWESTFTQMAGEFGEFTFQTTVTIKLVRVR
jgi:hypothetical protein